MEVCSHLPPAAVNISPSLAMAAASEPSDHWCSMLVLGSASAADVASAPATIPASAAIVVRIISSTWAGAKARSANPVRRCYFCALSSGDGKLVWIKCCVNCEPNAFGCARPRPTRRFHSHGNRPILAREKGRTIMGVKLVVAVTDGDWFDHLRGLPQLTEVNFWSPSDRTFRALEPGELFLFKLHAPRNFIVGGGWFAHAT